MYFYSLVLILSGDIEINPGPTYESVVDIIHLNVRRIRNKIDSLNAIVSDFDIACFTETHLDHNISNNDILLDGFDMVLEKIKILMGVGSLSILVTIFDLEDVLISNQVILNVFG